MHDDKETDQGLEDDVLWNAGKGGPSWFNPEEPFVCEKGYEYDNFGAFISGRKKDNGRNGRIEGFWSWHGGRQGLEFEEFYVEEWLFQFYLNYSAEGHPLQARAEHVTEDSWIEERCRHIPKAARRFEEGFREHRRRSGVANFSPPSALRAAARP